MSMQAMPPRGNAAEAEAARLIRIDKVAARHRRIAGWRTQHGPLITVDTIISRTQRGPRTGQAHQTTQRDGRCLPWHKAKLLGFDKPDQHKTDVTFINKPLPFPTKEIEMTRGGVGREMVAQRRSRPS